MSGYNKIYFPGLNGIRGLGAILVLISHILKEAHHFGLEKRQSLPISHYGLIIFFALSGFLITFLLLEEKKISGNISITNFYMRRVLRIWPVYFVYLFFVWFTCNYILDIEFKHSSYIALYIFFLPNIAFNLNLYPPFTGHLWSIGIEEQFYLVWPFVIKYIKNIKKVIFWIITFSILFRILGKYLSVYYNLSWVESIPLTWRFDCLGIGAWFALFYHNNRDYRIKEVVVKIVEISFWVIFIAGFKYKILHVFSFLWMDVISVLTGFIILSQVNRQNSWLNIDRWWMNWLGKISYGVYVYQILIIELFRYITMEKMGIRFTDIYQIILPCILLTITISALSYYLMERYFLKAKKYFQIRNRPNYQKV